MTSYKQVQIFPQDKTNYVTIRTTDPPTIGWIVAEVKRQLGSCDTRSEIYDLAGNMAGCELHRLSGKDVETFRWVFRRLCEDGWEPYYSAYGSHWLRKISSE